MVIYADKIESHTIPAPFQRSIRVLLAPDTQEIVKDVSITMGVIAPQSRNDYHTHEGTELLYIVTGHGTAVIDDKEYPIGPDALIVAPPNTLHQQINESDETMKMLAIWTPPVLGSEVVERAVEAVEAGGSE
jgi:mannose-6-phosphate isomerase-like protein (cupin superfamily)